MAQPQFHDSSDLLNVLETTTYDIEPDAIVLAIRPYELDHFVSALQDQLPQVLAFLEKPVGVSRKHLFNCSKIWAGTE